MALPLAAFSQESTPNTRKNKESKSDYIAMFSHMDAATRIQLMKQFDKDGDGRLNPEEREEAMKSLKDKSVDLEQMKLQHAQNVIKKFDKDGDGKLDPTEVSNFLEEQRKMFDNSREGMVRRNNRPVPAEILAKYDKDGDGKLSSEERQAMRKEMVEKRKALVEKYDKNGDGKLDDAEKEQLLNDPEVRNMMKRMMDNPPPNNDRQSPRQNNRSPRN